MHPTASASDYERRFEERVVTRYRLYAGLFLGLPFERLQQLAQLLPVFTEHCRRLLAQGLPATEIVARFFGESPLLAGIERSDVLFLFAQFVERQIVLFDALEDESFGQTHGLDAAGSVSELIESAARENQQAELGRLLERTATRIVLTAHPTQFYPKTVQGIIDDLRQALVGRDPAEAERLLLQMGKTRFTNATRPTPVEEAAHLVDAVADVFYEIMPRIVVRTLVAAWGRDVLPNRLPSQPNLQLGFWPGGDRDGNPYVTAEVTEQVASLMRGRVLQCHLASAHALARRLTFEGAYEAVLDVVARLSATSRASTDVASLASTAAGTATPYASATELFEDLLRLRQLVVERHQGLFVEQVDDLLVKVHLFGFYLGSLDIRQSSQVFARTLQELADLCEVRALGVSAGAVEEALTKDASLCVLEEWTNLDVPLSDVALARLSPLAQDTIAALRLVPTVQQHNGELGLHRVIVSHTHRASDILAVLVLARFAGLDLQTFALDVVPLFESVDDLERSEQTLARLFACPMYRDHLRRRGDRQTVMMGFSDGTKDGGYITANLAIRRARRRLSALGRRQGVEIVFFDGRGGPPARGGGNTNRFYRSRDLGIDQWHQQVTIQGQTISTNFGSVDLARYHVEQLFTANLENLLRPSAEEDPPLAYRELLDELSRHAERAYRELRDDPLLLSFLAERSPLPLFDHLTIGSRPAARKPGAILDLEQLRAIPFVATWSVLKMQVPGFYGLGTAFEWAFQAGHEPTLRSLYRESRFFRALLDNASMSLLKSRLDLHAHLQQDERFSPLFLKIQAETERSSRAILRVSQQPRLMASDPVTRRSIEMREAIVLPLLVIVQDAIVRYLEHQRNGTAESPAAVPLRKLSLKGIAAIINATRNAA